MKSPTYLRNTSYQPEGTFLLIGEDQTIRISNPNFYSNIVSSVKNYELDIENYSTQIEWIAEVESIKQKIKEGKITKEVAFRKLHSHSRTLPVDILNKIKKRTGLHYMVTLSDQSTWFGNSPEKVIERKTWANKDIITLEILGGSVSKEKNFTVKEHREHRVIIDDLIERLGSIGVEEVMYAHDEIKLDYIKHLKTRIMCTIDKSITNEQLISCIHPSLAIKGSNKTDREFYGGLVGWEGINGDLHLWLNIRSGKYKDDLYTFWVGCGITEDSDAEKEWEETNLKIKWMY